MASDVKSSFLMATKPLRPFPVFIRLRLRCFTGGQGGRSRAPHQHSPTSCLFHVRGKQPSASREDFASCSGILTGERLNERDCPPWDFIRSRCDGRFENRGRDLTYSWSS